MKRSAALFTAASLVFACLAVLPACHRYTRRTPISVQGGTPASRVEDSIGLWKQPALVEETIRNTYDVRERGLAGVEAEYRSFIQLRPGQD
jgi:hypothetical protein